MTKPENSIESGHFIIFELKFCTQLNKHNGKELSIFFECSCCFTNIFIMVRVVHLFFLNAVAAIQIFL